VYGIHGRDRLRGQPPPPLPRRAVRFPFVIPRNSSQEH
jgi:hypothetical protein